MTYALIAGVVVGCLCTTNRCNLIGLPPGSSQTDDRGCNRGVHHAHTRTHIYLFICVCMWCVYTFFEDGVELTSSQTGPTNALLLTSAHSHLLRLKGPTNSSTEWLLLWEQTSR